MKLTGGRPMTFIGSAFTDAVSGESVKYYKDYFGRTWMATSACNWFRVRRRNG